MTTEQRKAVIDATKQSIPAQMKGSRDQDAVRGALLSSLAMTRDLGFKKSEVLALVQEEWLHLTEIDNRTVKGDSK